MKQNLPKISTAFKDKHIRQLYEDNFQELAIDWYNLQIVWLNGVYQCFKDHDKYLILIQIVKKTFDHYSANFVNLTFDEYYKTQTIEIDKFNIYEIAKDLNISRETARRKIAELEKTEIIQKKKKNLLVKREAFKHVKPVQMVGTIVNFLNTFSKIYLRKDTLKKEITKKEIESCILGKFSHTWKLWYEMLIPNLLDWKKVFGDLETFHIVGTIHLNETYETNKLIKNSKIQLKNRRDFIDLTKNIENKIGINAMSISAITGIPRATVIRKLHKLINKKIILRNEKKLYHLDKKIFFFAYDIQSTVIKRLSNFTTQIFNLIKFS